MRKIVLGLLCVCAAWAQKLEFEVASIKPAEDIQKMVASGQIHVGLHVDGARVDIGAMALADLIQMAYKVKRYQVSGAGADGISAQRWNILAKLPEGSNKDQVPEMLQALLEDRFKLKIHRDTKEMAVYALVVGKGGPKLKESPPDADPAPGSDPNAPKPDERPQFKLSGNGGVVTGGPMGKTKVSMENGNMHFEMEKMPISALAEFLARFSERPVVDMTELKGNYQVALDISMEQLKNMARQMGVAIPAGGEPGKPDLEASDPSGSIFNTVQQLGLKLEPRKAPVEIIVVDHVEKAPTEN